MERQQHEEMIAMQKQMDEERAARLRNDIHL